jgi:hypothetical protein
LILDLIYRLYASRIVTILTFRCLADVLRTAGRHEY